VIPHELKHTIQGSVHFDAGLIELNESIESPGSEITASFFKTVMNTRDAKIHEGLVALGWTPPGGGSVAPLKLYVVESVDGDWLWSGKFQGQAVTMHMAIRRHSQGAKLVTYDVLAGSREEVKA